MAEEVEIIIKVDGSDGKKKIQDVNKELDKTQKNVKGMEKGTKNVSKGFKGMGKALAASGILLAVAAIVKVLSMAKDAILSNAAVSERWSDITAGLKTKQAAMADSVVKGAKRMKKEFDEGGGLLGLLDRVKNSEFGKKVKEGFESPGKAIKTLGELIVKRVINRFMGVINTIKFVGMAIGNLSKGKVKEMKQNFIDAGKASVDAMTGVKDSVDKVAKATKKVRDKIKEKNEQWEIARKKAEALNKEARLHLITMAETKGAIADVNAKIIEQRAIADDVNKTGEERMVALKAMIQFEQDIVDMKIKDQAESVRILKAQQELSSNKAEDNIELINAETKLQELQNQGDQKALMAVKKLGSLEKKASAEAQAVIDLKTDGENYLEELKIQNIQNDQERALAELEYQKQIDLAEIEQYENKELLKQEIDAKYKEEADAIKKEGDDATTTKEGEDRDDKVEKDMGALDKITDATDASFDVIANLNQAKMNKELKAAEGDEKKQEAIRKKFAEREKKMAITKIIIDGVLTIARTFADLGWPAGILGAVVAAATTAGQVAAVSSKQFADGGFVSGPGTGTSDSISARLSNGESVINAKSTAMFSDQLSAMNVMGGGVAFARGGIAGSTGSLDSGSNMEDIINKIGSIPVIVSEVDISNAQRSVQVVENESDL